MSITILYLWIMVAAGSSGREYRAWVPSGEFAGIAACETAIKRLAVKPELARCVDTGKRAAAQKGGA